MTPKPDEASRERSRQHGAVLERRSRPRFTSRRRTSRTTLSRRARLNGRDESEGWDGIVKIGRTHLQDATPIRLGQEFSGYAQQMHAERQGTRRGERCANCPSAAQRSAPVSTRTVRLSRGRARRTIDIPFEEAHNHFEAQHAKDAVVEASGHLKTIAISSKIANDIRWLGSGPRCGIGELKFPATQPGSSIMPGKVNPVMCEMAVQVACQSWATTRRSTSAFGVWARSST